MVSPLNPTASATPASATPASATPAPPAREAVTAASVCPAMATPVIQTAGSATQGQRLATNLAAESASVAAGYRSGVKPVFQAATTPSSVLVAVYHLQNTARADDMFVAKGAQFDAAINGQYRNLGVAFYASPTPLAGCSKQAVLYRHPAVNLHRIAVEAADANPLLNAGWVREATAYYVAGATAVQQPGSRGLPTGPTGLTAGPTAIPDTAYPVLAGAVFVSPSGNDAAAGTKTAPLRTLAKAVSKAPAGGTVVLRKGVYRESVTFGKALTIQPYPHEQAWLDGSVPLPRSGWNKTTNGYWMSWSTPSFCMNGYYSKPLTAQGTQGPRAYGDAAAGASADRPIPQDPQQVWINGVPQRQLAFGSKLTAGTFAYDWANRRLYLPTVPTTGNLEAAAKPNAMIIGKTRATVRGLGIRRYATSQSPNTSHGALYLGASVVVLERNLFTDMSAGAVSYSNPQPGSRVESNVFYRNGYTGIQGNGSSATGARNDLVIRGNLLVNQNDQKFGNKCTYACGPAAIKIGHMVGFVISGNKVTDTTGSGLWCDLDCSDGSYQSNVIERVTKHGIFDEVSNKSVVANNVVRNAEGCITVASANVTVAHNTVSDCNFGIRVYDDSRADGYGGWAIGPNTTNVAVLNNVISTTRLALDTYPGLPKLSAPTAYPASYASRVAGNVITASSSTAPVARWKANYTATSRTFTMAELAAYTGATGWEKGSYWRLAGSGIPLGPVAVPAQAAAAAKASTGGSIPVVGAVAGS